MATPISKKQYNVAGILVSVYGLDEIPQQASEVSCLWLLHPRLGTQERMDGIAIAAITEWNKKIEQDSTSSGGGGRLPARGLIAVSFDQRNHGTRLVDPLANEAWKQGNPRHAQDMFSIFRKYSVEENPQSINCPTDMSDRSFTDVLATSLSPL